MESLSQKTYPCLANQFLRGKIILPAALEHLKISYQQGHEHNQRQRATALIITNVILVKHYISIDEPGDQKGGAKKSDDDDSETFPSVCFEHMILIHCEDEVEQVRPNQHVEPAYEWKIAFIVTVVEEDEDEDHDNKDSIVYHFAYCTFQVLLVLPVSSYLLIVMENE